MGPIFNEKVTEKWNLWDLWIVHLCTVHGWLGQIVRLNKKKRNKTWFANVNAQNAKSKWHLDGRQGGCFLGVMDGLTLRWWQMKARSIPGASQASHANTSIFLLRNSTNSSFFWRGNCVPTWKNFFEVSPTTTFFESSHFASLAVVSGGDTGAFDCYKSLSAETEESVSSQCKMAATTHCLILDWQPQISRT